MNAGFEDDVFRGALIGVGLCMAELLADAARRSDDPEAYVENFGNRVSTAISAETAAEPKGEGVAQAILDNVCRDALGTLGLLG